jgi:hypothetical protein
LTIVLKENKINVSSNKKGVILHASKESKESSQKSNNKKDCKEKEIVR